MIWRVLCRAVYYFVFLTLWLIGYVVRYSAECSQRVAFFCRVVSVWAEADTSRQISCGASPRSRLGRAKLPRPSAGGTGRVEGQGCGVTLSLQDLHGFCPFS